MRSAVALALFASTGCALAHEAGAPPSTTTTADAGLVHDAGFMQRPDAFVGHDAWSQPFVMAPHAPEWLIPDQGGPRIAHPQLVVITFADDPRRAADEANVRFLATSMWLATVGAEYGVGDGSLLGVVERADAAPPTIDDTGIATLIARGISDRSIPTPTSGALGDALYVIYFPITTMINFSGWGTSCTAFGGYHNGSTLPDGRSFSYAVVPTCPDPMAPGVSEIEWQQSTLAHEVIEAATDALPLTTPAWAFSRMMTPPSPWLLIGAEVADLCELREGASSITHEAGYALPRIWSNAAARAGDRDPCIPADTTAPYFAVSITPDEITAVNPGGVTTFDVLGWSTAPVPPFSVYAYAPPAAGPLYFTPTVMLDRSMLTNGIHATLTVGVPPGTPSGSFGLSYVVVMASGSSDMNFFPVGVYTP